MADSSQKFIARNRAPRVQIEYDVELYGAEKKVQLPFVMGVLSDLSGKSHAKPPSLDQREFLEIDVDNFDKRMRGLSPRVEFSVPNTLTGEGNMAVDITFESMDDFSPAAIARKVEPLRKLLEARTQLSNLMTYMDGKTGAEDLIAKLIADPTTLRALTGVGAASDADRAAALDALRGQIPDDAQTPDTGTQDALDALRNAAPDEPEQGDGTDAALASLATQAVDQPQTDTTADVLAALGKAAPEDTIAEDTTTDALASLAAAATQDAPAEDTTASALEGLVAAATPDTETRDITDAALAGLAALQVDTTQEDNTDDVLASLGQSAPDDMAEDAGTKDALAGLAATAPMDVPEEDTTAAALDGLATAAVEAAPEPDGTDGALAALAERSVAETSEPDTTQSALEALKQTPIEDPQGDDGTSDALAGLAATASDADEPADTSADALASLADTVVEQAADDGSDMADALSSLAETATEDSAPDQSSDAALAGLAARTLDETPEENATAAALESLGKAAADLPDDVPEDAASALEGLASSAPDDKDDDADLDLALSGLVDAATDDLQPTEDVTGILDGLAAASSTEGEPDTSSDDALAALAETAIEDSPDEGSDAALDALLTSIEDTDETPDTSVDAALEALADAPVDLAETDTTGDALAGLADAAIAETESDDPTADILAELADATPAEDLEQSERNDALDALVSSAPDDPQDDTGLDDILAGITEAPAAEDVATDDVLASLADLDQPEPASDSADDILASLTETGDADPLADLDDVLESISSGAPDTSGDFPSDDTPLDAAEDELANLDALLSDDTANADDLMSDLDAILDDSSDTTSDLDALLSDDPAPDNDPLADLDGLLEDTQNDTADLDALLADPADAADDPLADLDALLADDGDAGEDPLADLDALLSDDGESDDPLAGLDDILDAQPDDAQPDDASPQLADKAQIAFGVMSTDRPDANAIPRDKFRIAILGDFSGRAASGKLAIGDDLANREPIRFDIDDVEELIKRFATKLVLPLGKDGKGIEVSLRELDDLHPDELYENVDIFAEISGMRQRLKAGSMADAAVEKLKEWGAQYGSENLKVRAPSAATNVPADRKLSDFSALIGDVQGRLATPAPGADFIAQIMAPHVVAAPDPGANGMLQAVDQALSSAMRLILHAPAFQAIEAQWRSLDFLARRVETDHKLELVLYDVSAEEIAADLAAQEDLAGAGITRMLAEIPVEEDGPGGFSAIMGLYTFEETPPHAELLARVSRLAAHIDAPVFAAMSPEFMKTPRKDRHPLVAKAWDDLRAMPEAKYLGLVTPRFMMRRPYGAKTNPVSAFAFEEFTPKAGLKSLLYANPVVAVTVLLAGSFTRNGKAMGLGEIMSLGNMPYHFVDDAHGDQVALPCTERNITTTAMEDIVTRGFMPIVSPRGRDEIRLASFQAVGGGEILGPWTNVERPAPSAPPKADPAPAGDDTDDDDLDLDLDLDLDVDLGSDGGDDLDLDALLSEFGDTDDSDDDGDIDSDLAALLEGL